MSQDAGVPAVAARFQMNFLTVCHYGFWIPVSAVMSPQPTVILNLISLESLLSPAYLPYSRTSQAEPVCNSTWDWSWDRGPLCYPECLLGQVPKSGMVCGVKLGVNSLLFQYLHCKPLGTGTDLLTLCKRLCLLMAWCKQATIKYRRPCVFS